MAEQTDGTLIGLVHIIFHSHNWRVENVCGLQDLYISPRRTPAWHWPRPHEATYALMDEAAR
jgi:hypothetical protein